MKNIVPCILLFFIQLAFFTGVAQEAKPVQFANGNFKTNTNIANGLFKNEDIRLARYNDVYYVLVQFNSLPSAATKQHLQQEGISLEGYLPGNAYLATIKNNFDFRKAKSFQLSAINSVPSFYKIDQKLIEFKEPADKEQTYKMAVTFYQSVDKKMVSAALQQLGAIIVNTRFDDGNSIFIQVNTAIVDAIASLPFVSSITLETLKDKTLNYNGIAAHGISGLNALNGKNLNGKNVTIGVGDNADISTHIDFAGRLINRTSTTPENHGTHTSGTTAGAGIINVKNHGMAPRATIINQYFSDIIVNTPAYITDYNMVLSNNSYHAAETGCAGEGQYNVLSIFADKQLAQNKEVLHVFAAGNDGANTCTPYPASFGTIKSGWQTAKNVLTVGAIKTLDYTNASFSSRGPVKDGRIKPEITSGGLNVLSTNVYNNYGYNTGTSMACPAVTGSIALMYERYRQLNSGANPSAALMKALVCNTAEDLGNAGPDYTFGFGMLNARRAVEAIENNRYITSSITNNNITNHTISIPANTKKLKIMLYWADSAAAVNAATALVNDLDLIVVEPTATVHRPLILNAAPANVNNVAIEGQDHTNNIEQVVIDNPPAGIYTINIYGYAIPFSSQDYVISYEIVQAGVTVEYPFGGETLVPGETETIRWNAAGDDANTFTIEYSTDKGSNWSLINNSVAASARLYNWIVPKTVTNNALIRVSRNSSSFTDISDFSFTVLGQPVVSGTNVCEGAVQLDWEALSGATSYNIVQLVNDTMQIVGNTTSNSFVLAGLNKNKTYWLGVAAKNGTVQGRRSVSLQVLPNSGPCTLALFNNDIKVDTILEPATARQLFANAANATKPVKIAIKNQSNVTVSGPFDASYSYTGGATITETINTTIAAGGTFTYTFSGIYPQPAAGYRYDFNAWVTKVADVNHQNDTAYKTVQNINNDAITVTPLVENFDVMSAVEIRQNEMAIGGNKYLDFSTNTTRGRARTLVNSGFALSGNQALTLDQSPFNDITSTDSAIFNYNLSLLNGNQLRFDFYYRNHGQANNPGNKVWIRGSENNNWIEAYDLFGNQADLGEWKKGIININDLLATALPAQNLTATFQIKLGQEGNTSANNPNPVSDIDDGYTFDNMVLNKAVNDVSVLKINSPDKNGCSLSSNSAISINIKNYNNAILSNLLVSYQVNNGSIVTENISSIAANQSLNYAFNQLYDFSAYTSFNINVWVKYPGDSYAANDSILNYIIYNSPVINSFPYLQTFENDNGFFFTNGTSSTWQWGTPAKALINKAPNGSKAWVTNLSGNYTDNETSYLVSPCFDISSLTHPVLSFSHVIDIELDYDYTWVEYTIDGKTWQKLGAVNSGTNWYDNAPANNWRASNAKWHVASIDLPVTGSNIRFRFVLSSDVGVTQEGIGIDDVRVHEKSVIAGSGGTIYPGTVTGGWTNNWVPFTFGSQSPGPFYSIAEINSNGQNLGTVTIQPYLNYPGPIRNTGNQYYLNRNFVIQSTIPPTGNMGVRLYFTDEDANALIKASGCVNCAKLFNAYELGVTKYSGNPAEENGTLDDNFSGYYQFTSPANTHIYPHGNGYYAEFTINSFSEFWLGKDLITPASNSVCAGTTITYSVPAGAGNYQWQENSGTGYSNIINGAGYSGSTTNSLQLINPPGNKTGYKYRCIIDGANSAENILRFRNLWTGATNTDWLTATNWSCGTVPDQYTDVIIPGSQPRYPVINTSTSIRSIKVLNSATVTLPVGVVLDIKGK